MENVELTQNRREFIKKILLGSAVLLTGTFSVLKILNRKNPRYFWQIDRNKCIQCGRCATECVLAPSAVKCVHEFKMCGYCELCGGYFRPEAVSLNTGAENQICPMGAIKRKYIENPYYEYTIDEVLCIGCGKCVKGCASFGNASLFLQIKNNLCLNCNECAIARSCPVRAIQRVQI